MYTEQPEDDNPINMRPISMAVLDKNTPHTNDDTTPHTNDDMPTPLPVTENQNLQVPNFTHGLSDITAKEGARITLQCEITGIPQPQVTWWQLSFVLSCFHLIV